MPNRSANSCCKLAPPTFETKHTLVLFSTAELALRIFAHYISAVKQAVNANWDARLEPHLIPELLGAFASSLRDMALVALEV